MSEFLNKVIDNGRLKEMLFVNHIGNPFYKKVAVFVGRLQCWSMEDAKSLLHILGAEISLSINNSVQAIIVGQDVSDEDNAKINGLMGNDSLIKIYNEERFCEATKHYKYLVS